MEWTVDDRKYLLNLKHSLDSDNIKVKEKIKKELLDNQYIIHVLNNKDLQSINAGADDYYNVNIFPTLSIPFTQSKVDNFICYEVRYETVKFSNIQKKLQVVFNVVCQSQTIIDKETGLPRHDLLAALIQDKFNYTNYFGAKLTLVSDMPSTVDKTYSARTLVFEQTTDNNVVKSKGGTPKIINKDTIQ